MIICEWCNAVISRARRHQLPSERLMPASRVFFLPGGGMTAVVQKLRDIRLYAERSLKSKL
jgi:hypothetical protein